MGLFGKKKDTPPPPPPQAQPPAQPQSVEQMMAGYDPAQAERSMHKADEVLNALGKVGRLGGKGFQARIAGAQANMAYSQQMMEQYSTMGGGAAVGSPSWLDAILHPQTDFVRQCTCEECGGQKKLPSPTAYMYCDYCAALVDYDFRKVVSAPAVTAMPDPAYVQWINQIGADKRAAVQAGDKARFEQLERQFFDRWITTSPQAVSHRCGDPVYRQGFIDFCVATSVIVSFDPGMQAMDAELKDAVTRMVYGGGNLGMMQINPDSFWPILDVVIRQQQTANALTAAGGARELDPDRTPEAVRKRIGLSTMVQGWMPYLTAEAGEEMLNRTGLQGEYKHVEPVADGATRHCGQCGQEFVALPGAKIAVCNSCGHKLDVGSAEWPCNTCGGLVTLPAGSASTTCPYCKGMVDRVGR
jgi:DNA-directed RNA polymerase subunit RPC12/RpoP